jgi:uncharacterized protein
MKPLDAGSVEVGGEIGRRIDVTVENNLLLLDIENDFLRPFREKTLDGGYVGLGKTIEAVVRLAAYTKDDRVLDLKNHIVDETLKTQEDDGYIGILRKEKRVWGLWDIHEMSYVIHGLAADFRLFGEQRSLEAAKKVADYIIEAWSAQPEKKPGDGAITVYMAVTGSEVAMLNLHDLTGDQRYLDYCLKLRDLQTWDGPIVIGRWGPVQGHAYAYMSRCLAQLHLNRIQPNPQLLVPTRRAIDFLRKSDGMVITGTCGDHECWHDTQEGTINLGETCTDAYLIRLLGELLQKEGNSLFGDMTERTIYNALFASQSPDGRRIRYYSPFDGPRIYFDKDTYCCPCNYRRILSELPDMVYYRSDGGLLVNLYTPSSATTELESGIRVAIRQETEYPHSGEITLHVDPSRPVELPLQLRIPRWCTSPSVAVNGQSIGDSVKGGTLYTIEREWEPHDRVTLNLPMQWRFVRGRKAQAGRVAVMRGPLVFCLNPAWNEGLADMDLRLITIDPSSLEGPFEDNTVHEGGQACRVRTWGPGVWYPQAEPDLNLLLTEYSDPGGEATYFKIPNPLDERCVEDELFFVNRDR